MNFWSRRDNAEAKADTFTAHFNAPPIPVVEIVENNGVDVVFADFGEYRERIAGFCSFSDAKIYVNRDDVKVRKYFTIAHEFGHWVLHREIYLREPDRYPVLPRFQTVDKSDQYEQEANAFAAALLVPSRLLRPVISAPISELAFLFGVSKIMMEIRAENVRKRAVFA